MVNNDDGNIVFLFNSASAPKYVENLLRTLAMPMRFVNKFRFTKDRNVPSDVLAEAREGKSRFVDKKCLLLYVDRFAADSYEFHPFRWGRVLDVCEAGARLEVHFEVDEYVRAANYRRKRSD